MRCLAIRGEGEVLRFPIPGAEARLGSDPSNDLVVPIVGVSRFHARLVTDGPAVRLFDLDSKNGLVVMGRRHREVVLLPGVVVQAGGAEIRLDDGATSDFDVAIELPQEAVASAPSKERPESDTETTASGPDDREALGLMRDLARFGEEGRTRPETGLLLERLRRVLGATAVAVFGHSPAGPRILLSCGETLGEGLLEALPKETGPGAVSFIDVEGCPAAFRAPSTPAGHSALVLLPPSASFSAWQRELLCFSLESLVDTNRELGRSIVESARPGPRLVFPEGMVAGVSPAMKGLFAQISKTVHSRIDVLILGETGTGKERIARMIHESGPTPAGPFVAINCAAIPSELLESELFGVRARIATGVDANPGRILEANGGTLLLDEIGELPLVLQPKLLRFLQEREVHSVGASRPEKVDLRVLSTSNRDLLAEVKAGRFRADLYYRLRGLQFHVPPLRDRKEDLPPLVAAFAARAAQREGKSIRGVSTKALDLLRAYDWPGNVRELQSEVTRAVLFCPNGNLLSSDHFGTVAWVVQESARARTPVPSPSKQVGAKAPVESAPEDSDVELSLRDRVAVLERDAISRALAKTAGNKTAASRLLGLTRAGLLMKLRRLGLDL